MRIYEITKELPVGIKTDWEFLNVDPYKLSLYICWKSLFSGVLDGTLKKE